jgi:hypothetical protein
MLTTSGLSDRPSSSILTTERHKFSLPPSLGSDCRRSFSITSMSNNLKQFTPISANFGVGRDPEPSKRALLPQASSVGSTIAITSRSVPWPASVKEITLPGRKENRPAVTLPHASLRFTGLLITERRLECKKKITINYHAYRLRPAWARFPSDGPPGMLLRACRRLRGRTERILPAGSVGRAGPSLYCPHFSSVSNRSYCHGCYTKRAC